MSDKVLVVRKPDGTIHVVELANEASLKNLNNKKPSADKWKFEHMERSQALKLPFIDPDFIKPADAMEKVSELSKENEQKDKEIEDLRKKLAALQGGSGGDQGPGNPGTGAGQDAAIKENAPQKIERINAAKTVDEVKAILGDDDRKTVLDAAAKMMAQLAV